METGFPAIQSLMDEIQVHYHNMSYRMSALLRLRPFEVFEAVFR